MTGPRLKHPHATSIYFDDDTVDTLKALMKERGLSRSAVIRIAIKEMASQDPKRRARVQKALTELQTLLAP